jgi:hypothetical protein
MRGYDFREGQVRDNDGAYGHVFRSRVRAMVSATDRSRLDRHGKMRMWSV